MLLIRNAYLLVITFSIIAISCMEEPDKKNLNETQTKKFATFDENLLKIREQGSIKKLHGQILYLPVYSSIPYIDHGRKYDLSAFVAIHNTDFKHNIKISKVLYFDNDGKLVSDYLKKDTIIHPLGATNFFVPEKDQSGTGANFIVEWISDSAVNEPLIESVMIGLTGGQGVSFTSPGKILRELK